MAEVLPFPLARRRGLILKQAAWFCEQTERGAEANLFRLLQIQRDSLMAKGVDPELVETEVRSLEIAIRSEALRWAFSPEVGA